VELVMDSGRYERVCYFGENDLFHYPYFKRMDEVTSQPMKEFSSYSIVDIIELHNIIQYIDNGNFCTDWNENKKNRLKKLRNQYKQIVCCFFKSIDGKNIVDYFTIVKNLNFYKSDIYIKGFWFSSQK